MKHKVYCDGENLYIDGEYAGSSDDCLEEVFENIASALDINYEYIDELEE